MGSAIASGAWVLGAWVRIGDTPCPTASRSAFTSGNSVEVEVAAGAVFSPIQSFPMMPDDALMVSGRALWLIVTAVMEFQIGKAGRFKKRSTTRRRPDAVSASALRLLPETRIRSAGRRYNAPPRAA